MIIISGIYRILNIKTNKNYIGSSKHIANRLKDHKSALRRGTHHSFHLQRAWNKHGEENFIFEILEIIENFTPELLLEKEQLYMDQYKSYEREFGYNINIKSVSGAGRKHTQEAKDKISKAGKGRKHSEEFKEHLRQLFTGRKVSPEIIQKAKENRLKNGSYNITEETREKLRKSHIGKFLSEEQKRKISEKNKGKINSKEAIEKAKQTRLLNGYKHSQDTRNKIKEKRKQQIFSKETKEIWSKQRQGENNKLAKLTNKDIIEMRKQFFIEGLKFSEIAKNFNIHKKTIRSAVLGITWKHVPDFSKEIQLYSKKTPIIFTSESIDKIRNTYATEIMTYKILGKQFEVSSAIIRNIIYNVTWFNSEYDYKNAISHQKEMRQQKIKDHKQEKNLQIKIDKRKILGRKQSEETKKKRSESLKNRIFSERTKKLLSEKSSGENSHTAKLTIKNIKEIRRLYCEELINVSQIAQQFNISKSHTNAIIKGKAWKSVSDSLEEKAA